MCIRDSDPSSRHREKVGKQRQLRHKSRVSADASARLVKRCLLYTSDAADERSSVDLGGRRIIKKKKKRQRQELDDR